MKKIKMTKVNTSELVDASLDWAVAKCMGVKVGRPLGWNKSLATVANIKCYPYGPPSYSPSTEWRQGGPIIERQRIRLEPLPDNGWRGYLPGKCGIWVDIYGREATPLVAAMRCYVASKMGDEVEVPDELL